MSTVISSVPTNAVQGPTGQPGPSGVTVTTTTPIGAPTNVPTASINSPSTTINSVSTPAAPSPPVGSHLTSAISSSLAWTSSDSTPSGALGGFTGRPNGSNTTSSTQPQHTLPDVASTGSSSGMPAGAVAGIAIGCLIVGLLAGLLAACVILRRKREQANKADGVPIYHNITGPANEKTSETTTNTHASDIQLDRFLLEAIPDSEIAQEVRSLGDLIQQHVESYYHSKLAYANINGLSTALTRLGFSGTGSSVGAQKIAALCLDPKTRHFGIRHVIMRAVFKSIDFSSQKVVPSILPWPIASFLQAMSPAQHDQSSDPQATSLALRRWRNLSVFLLHPNRSYRTSLPLDEAAVGLQARKLTESLNCFLGVFVEPHSAGMQQQENHLQAVITECAKLGHVLLSQPGDWGLVTDVTPMAAEETQPVSLVLEAGLHKLSDRDGPPYSHPRTVIEPVVVRLPLPSSN